MNDPTHSVIRPTPQHRHFLQKLMWKVSTSTWELTFLFPGLAIQPHYERNDYLMRSNEYVRLILAAKKHTTYIISL